MSTPENFIPWEQIEPLLRDGMNADDLKAALCALTGLDGTKYRFVTRVFSGGTMTFSECLRDGLYAERYDSPDGTSKYIPAGEGRLR